MRKKIIPFLVVFAIVASSLVPVFATETGSFYKPVGIEEWAETRDPDGGFQNVLEDYDGYVTDLENDYGSSVVTGSGFRLYATASSSDFPGGCPVTLGQFASFGPFLCNSLYQCFSYDTVVAPVDGYYTYFCDVSLSDGCSLLGYGFIYPSPSSGYVLPCTKRTAVNAGTVLLGNNGRKVYFRMPTGDFASGSISHGWLVEPLGVSVPDVNSRPTSINGDYGIIGDDGTIIKVDGDMIVDESSNTIYNPVTNTTISFTDYTYDYSDRSYNLTLEDGSTMKVIYGDENVTINEGDTIYNIYYLVEDDSGGGSGDGGDGSGDKHTHDYTSEITKQPSCLISGVRTFTCACGDSYTKTISATGHDWVISQQVPTTYDPETGEQTQAGYTVYVCGSCAEQYKSTDGSAPPNGSSGGDDSSGGFGDIIVGLFSVIGDIIGGLLEGALVLATKALEALTGLGDLFAQMITTILGFFGGFIDFLSAMFPFLPEETTTILNFGLILMIAAAVFNKFFK